MSKTEEFDIEFSSSDDFDEYDYDFSSEDDELDEYFYSNQTVEPPTQEELDNWESFNREIARTLIPNDYKEWM